jgi:CxxC motif-containing protein
MYNKKIHDNQDFICVQCGWTCKGNDLVNNNSSKIFRIQDLQCPRDLSYSCILTNTDIL